MPTDAKVGNPRAGKPGANAPKKGAPLGIPKWGWVVGIALGLIVGYMVIKKSGSSSSNGSSSGSDSSPLGNSDSGSGGGASSGSSSPNNPVIIGAGGTQTPTSDPGAVSGTGDSSTSTNPAFTPSEPASSFPAYILSPGNIYSQQTSPGSSTYEQLPPSHPNNPTGPSMLPDAMNTGSVRRPGFQPDS